MNRPNQVRAATDSAKKVPSLPLGTRLDKYIINKVIGGGGFSIVYLAQDCATEEQVVIKEYFPVKLARRESDNSIQPSDEKTHQLFSQGRKLFFQEASILAAIKHASVVEIKGFFRHNNTIYTVMEYAPGMSLQQRIKQHGKYADEVFIRGMFVPVLQSLQQLHEKNLLHLDIKPGNIYIKKNGEPLLLDFGAVRKLDVSTGTKFFPVVSHGFSPIEQNSKTGQLGAWSDLYALGATMRTCIEARAPISAKQRLDNDSLVPAAQAYQAQYSEALLYAIDWSMQLKPKKRPQSVEQLLFLLNKSPA